MIRVRVRRTYGLRGGEGSVWPAGWKLQEWGQIRVGGQIVSGWADTGRVFPTWGEAMVQVTGQSPYGDECDCYPWGASPDSYEGPQRSCPVHNPWHPCSRCGKPTAYLAHADGGPGAGWRHVFPADDRQLHVGYPMARGID